MQRSTVRVSVLVLIALTLSALTVGTVVANDGSLVVGDGVDIPPQTVTFDGTEYPVSTLVQVTRGEPLTARATGPENVSGVDLYDVDGSLVYDRPASLNESVRFSTTYLTPGEYLIATHDGSGRYQTVQPVAVTGYDVSLSTSPMETNEGQRQFTVNVTETAQTSPIDRVEVVVFRGDETARVPTSKSAEGTYTGTTNLEPGEYQLYARATVDGQLVGLSNGTTMRITAQNQTTQANGSTQTTQTSEPTQTTQSTQATQTTTTPANATAGERSGDGVEAQLSGLVGSRVANLLSGSLFVVVGVVGVLVLSTVAYQAAYSLRRR
ncbi:hypothetical protein [Halogranum rubrum]|uniref:Uncharacterized protein n=1 Tax=Halogranum salarium B-1 TaxID=1210908 RepID=J2ZIJ4_9EURY|nr:hypothetical protein [Halogranum salarium]EJN60535.1 hypothetical protein HSB1_11380 [Halogranum salarium B-1]